MCEVWLCGEQDKRGKQKIIVSFFTCVLCESVVGNFDRFLGARAYIRI